MLCDSGTGVGVLQRVLFLPLRADGRGKRFCRRFVTTGSTNTGAQGLQHCAVGFVFDACGQRSGLYRSAVQDAFDGRRIGFAAKGSADLLCDSGTGVGVLQAVLFLPLRADSRGERFDGVFVALGSGEATAQGLQHRAVGFGTHTDWQCRRYGCLFCDFFGDTAQDGFYGRGIGFARATQGSDDPLRDGIAYRFVLQVVVGVQLAADAGGERFLRGGVLRFADAVAQGFEQLVVVGFVEACRGLSRFFGSAVQYGFHQRGVVVSVATEDGSHLFGDGGADGAVLQAVLVLPLVANGGGEHFLYFGAVGVVQAGAQGFHHYAVGVLTHAFGQDIRHALRHMRQHGVQHAFIYRAFAGKRRFQVGNDVVAGFAFGGDALLQPLTADAVGEYRLHVFVRAGSKATAQGAQHAVIGLFADAVRGFVRRQSGSSGRGEAGLYRHGSIASGIRLGEDVGNPLRLRAAFVLEAGEQALRDGFAQRRIVGDALLPLAADGFGERRLHISIRLAHAQTALQGAQRLVVAFLSGKIAGSGSRCGDTRRLFLALVRNGIRAGRRYGFVCCGFYRAIAEGEVVCGKGNGGRFVLRRSAHIGGGFFWCRFCCLAGEGNCGSFRCGASGFIHQGDVIKGGPFVVHGRGRGFRDRNGSGSTRSRCGTVGESQLARQGIERLLFALRRIQKRQAHPLGDQCLLQQRAFMLDKFVLCL